MILIKLSRDIATGYEYIEVQLYVTSLCAIAAIIDEKEGSYFNS